MLDKGQLGGRFDRGSGSKHYLRNESASAFSGKGFFRRWERDQGGIWEFAAKGPMDGSSGICTIKLHTLLSSQKLDQANPMKLYDVNHIPGWQALISLLAARNKRKSEAWAMQAAEQCKHFLDLKADGDLLGVSFPPSKAIDETWHTHLRFVDRYQKDALALTKGEHLIEHLPVESKDAPGHHAAVRPTTDIQDK